MKKKLLVFMMALTLAFCSTGCSALMLAVAVDMIENSEDATDYYEETTEYVKETDTAPENGTENGTDDVTEPEKEEDKVTILIYMNGSDLESNDGQATMDITEMVEAAYSEEVNILIQTMGTMDWRGQYDISSRETQRFQVIEDDIQLVSKRLGQLDCTKSDTLRDFIEWGVEEYPAERYILLFWNHGGGPVYGFGYDEFKGYDANLSLSEIQEALDEAGTDFELIGMDCCIMSSLEVCYALYNYCDYAVLSEEFETGIGWSYKGFLTALANDPEMSIEQLSRIIIDDMIEANEQDTVDEPSTLALIDQSMIKVLYSAWKDFAYANEKELLKGEWRIGISATDRARADIFRWDTGSEDTMADYCLTDMMHVAQSIDSKEASALENILEKTIVYYRGTGDVEHLTGLSVTIPYGDSDFYDLMYDEFIDLGLDEEYVEWLEQFCYVRNAGGFEFVD